MTKKELYKAMDGRISMSSIGEYSDEIVILGKFGIVSWMDGYWDIWITGVHRTKELSSNKVKRAALGYPTNLNLLITMDNNKTTKPQC